MMRIHSRLLPLAACLGLAALPALAEEGKWTPQQVLQLDAKWLKQMGLQLPVSKLWDPARGAGLLAGAVSLGGCSAGFVSPTGLILTNHHCLFSVIQEHSRPDRDLITNGFLARTQAEELRGSNVRVSVPRKFTDVTKEMEAAAPAGATDLARTQAIEAKQKTLAAECEKRAGSRCRVYTFDGGLQYVLVDTIELTDVRLVYAPPREVGEFGGEDDNFRWPRHTGDFSMARVYQDGKPYKPEFYFPISQTGVKPGDFVMVLGYPGRTVRSLTAAEMANQRDFTYAPRFDLYGEWLRILDEAAKQSAEAAITVAATQKSLANSHTNSEGQLAGLKRGKIIDKQRAADAAVVAWAAKKGGWEKALEAKRQLDQLAEARRQTGMRDYLFSVTSVAPLALRNALSLVRLAAERAKPDAARDPDYAEREWPRLRTGFERDQKSYYAPADEAIFNAWVERARKLPANARIAAVEPLQPAASVRAFYAATKVTQLEERLKMCGETADQLRARKDPLLEFAFTLETELARWREATKTNDGAVARLRPEWRRAVIAYAGKPVAPDANSTLRVSFAHVSGYQPRDGVQYTPQTTLAGMVEKHTGVEPFNAPKAVLEAAARVDAAKVPLNFLSSADTTGGNSGSPVVNGKGELVGLNFDRVWENVANDFGYNPEIARNISVDIRFFLWMLKEVSHGDAVLGELGVK